MSKLASPDGLSPAQLQVASALASGASISKAARTCNIGRTTIYTWINTIPLFAQTIRAASSDAALQLSDQIHDTALDAISTISALINDPAAPPSVRLRAALAVLNRPSFPDKGWALPFPIGTPAEIRQQEINNHLEADLKTMELESQMRQHVVAAAEAEAQQSIENGTVRNNSEQKTGNSPAVPPIVDPEAYRTRIAESLMATLAALPPRDPEGSPPLTHRAAA
jgi:transposase-like protein